ncbi:MAG TPA: hypothetical protein P5145_06620 [Tenuifilaceae bacterium]|nr:hypothetical protein [Tenuifilaceae bacterium]
MSEKEKIEFNDFKAGKELPFSVPEGYFDNLASRIQDRIQPSQTEFELSPVKEGWVFSLRSQLAFAAGFAFMAILAYFGYYMASPLAQKHKSHTGTDYVEIVSRSITDFEDIDLYRAIEKQRQQDSLDEVTKEMYRRYYIRSNNCITIIDEKKEIEP